MPGNKIQVASSTGKLKVRGSSGKIIVAGGTDPCCCTSLCALCNPTMGAATILLTLAGTTGGCGCTGGGGGSESLSGTANGTYCIPFDHQVPGFNGECDWSAVFTGGPTLTCYSPSDVCVGSHTTTSKLNISVRLVNTPVKRWIILVAPYDDSGAGCGVGFCYFYAEVSTDTECDTTAVGSNAAVACFDTVGTLTALTIGGTATLVVDGC
jgi:hypothetical protein